MGYTVQQNENSENCHQSLCEQAPACYKIKDINGNLSTISSAL